MGDGILPRITMKPSQQFTLIFVILTLILIMIFAIVLYLAVTR